MAGRAKENIPGGSLKYLFVYLKVRIFKCSYRIYTDTKYTHHEHNRMHIHVYMHASMHMYHDIT